MTKSFDPTKLSTERAFDPSKPVQTRDGLKARIVCTDLQGCGEYVIGALVQVSADKEKFRTFTPEGFYEQYRRDGENPFDLINTPKKIGGWVNIYRSNTRPEGYYVGGTLYTTVEEANIKALPWRVACIKIEWEESE